MTEQEYQRYSKAQREYSSARYEILLLIICTIVNLFLLPTTGNYFVCSISLAIFYVIAMLAAQKDPSQFGVTEETARQALPVAIVMAAIITAVYLLFFFLSKRRRGFLITLLVFFSIDTFFCLLNLYFNPRAIVDIIVHILTIILISKGVSSGKILQEHFAKGVAVSAAEIRGYFEESQRQKADEAVNRAREPQLKDDDPFGYGTSAAQPTATQPKANIITNCPACGARRNGTDKFCPYCGTAYEAAKTDIQASSQSANATEQSLTSRAQQSSSADNSDDNEDLA